MSGHSHWAGIKRQKEANDQKRGKAFSKLLSLITAAAKSEPNPDFNPRLRTAVEKARAEKVPTENIERAIKRATEPGSGIEELTLEAYGPGGAALFIEAITDNKNRTIPQLKKIIADNGGKWAESGSVAWAFEPVPGTREWKAKFPQEISKDDAEKLSVLVGALEDHDDVQNIFINVA
jgi:YebC/PmpR family DNA-binding regulatory protein